MLDIDASLKDTKFWQNINFYLVLIACNGKWKSSLKYVYKYENVLSIVWNVTLVTHITEYRKSTSEPRSPAPNEVRILTSKKVMSFSFSVIKSGLYKYSNTNFMPCLCYWQTISIPNLYLHNRFHTSLTVDQDSVSAINESINHH